MALRLRHGEIDLADGRGIIRGDPVQLTPLELDLLAYLAGRPDTVVRKEELAASVWNAHPETVQRAIEATLRRLRRKLGESGRSPDHLFTVPGHGVRFAPHPEASGSSTRDAWAGPLLSVPEATRRLREGGAPDAAKVVDRVGTAEQVVDAAADLAPSWTDEALDLVDVLELVVDGVRVAARIEAVWKVVAADVRAIVVALAVGGRSGIGLAQLTQRLGQSPNDLLPLLAEARRRGLASPHRDRWVPDRCVSMWIHRTQDIDEAIEAHASWVCRLSPRDLLAAADEEVLLRRRFPERAPPSVLGRILRTMGGPAHTTIDDDLELVGLHLDHGRLDAARGVLDAIGEPLSGLARYRKARAQTQLYLDLGQHQALVTVAERAVESAPNQEAEVTARFAFAGCLHRCGSARWHEARRQLLDAIRRLPADHYLYTSGFVHQVFGELALWSFTDQPDEQAIRQLEERAEQLRGQHAHALLRVCIAIQHIVLRRRDPGEQLDALRTFADVYAAAPRLRDHMYATFALAALWRPATAYDLYTRLPLEPVTWDVRLYRAALDLALFQDDEALSEFPPRTHAPVLDAWNSRPVDPWAHGPAGLCIRFMQWARASPLNVVPPR